MRSLHAWIGAGVFCTCLGAGLIGQKVFGQPDTPKLVFPPPVPPPSSLMPRTVIAIDPAPIQIPPGLPDSVPMSPLPVDAARNPPLPGAFPPPSVPVGVTFPPVATPPLPASIQPTSPGPKVPSVGTQPPVFRGQDVKVSGILPPSVEIKTGKVDSSLTTEWVGPPIVKLGQPMQCQILVRNNGTTAVHQVVVRHEMPQGVEHRQSQPEVAADGRLLTWHLGTLEAGQTQRINVQFVAQMRGPLNCSATVTFVNGSALQVVVREPLLTLKVKGPEKVVAGEEARFTITLSNPGDGLTDKIALKATLPEGLEHPRGRSLQIDDVAPLAPNESRTMQLVCIAKGSGRQELSVVANAETNLKAVDMASCEILLPRLDLAVTGPKLRYVERKAVYLLKVSNPGSAPASAVTLTEVIPAGFKFIQAGSGRHDEKSNSVTWFVGDLMPGQQRDMTLELVAKQPGDHRLVGLVNSARGVKTEAEIRTHVEGLSKLEVELIDTEDPVEVGAETTYEIRVLNSGTKLETNLNLICTLPEQLELVAAKNGANLRYRMEGRSLIFESLASLAPRADIIFRVQAKGMQAGNFRFRAQVRADSLPEPIVREEVTRVYNDEVPLPR